MSLSVLKGLFKAPYDTKIDIIQFEMHFDDMYLRARTYDEMKELLNQNGYRGNQKNKTWIRRLLRLFFIQNLVNMKSN